MIVDRSGPYQGWYQWTPNPKAPKPCHYKTRGTVDDDAWAVYLQARLAHKIAERKLALAEKSLLDSFVSAVPDAGAPQEDQT